MNNLKDIPIDVWFGGGDYNPTGPLEATLIEIYPDWSAKVHITDTEWLDSIGWGQRP